MPDRRLPLLGRTPHPDGPPPPAVDARPEAPGAAPPRPAGPRPDPRAPIPDARGRPLGDLRISVTDRCNFRCSYCMPREHFGDCHVYLPRTDLLSFEEIERVAGAAVALGVRKIRLTGGEPLLRRELHRLVAHLAALGVELALTTNGVLLARHAAELARAGLGRVTVSLDAIDDPTFRRLVDADVSAAEVLAGMAAAEAAGLGPVKVNCVVRRGLNEHAPVEILRAFRGTGRSVRFIEFMDVGTTNGWRLEDVVPARELLARLRDEFALTPVEPAYRGEVARRWRRGDGGGEVGFITSVTEPFCGDCTRLRLAPDGRLLGCLFAGAGLDLRPLLRGGADDAALLEAVRGFWSARADRYSELRGEATAGLPRVEMSYVGG